LRAQAWQAVWAERLNTATNERSTSYTHVSGLRLKRRAVRVDLAGKGLQGVHRLLGDVCKRERLAHRLHCGERDRIRSAPTGLVANPTCRHGDGVILRVEGLPRLNRKGRSRNLVLS
jgi:hypothetical protein